LLRHAVGKYLFVVLCVAFATLLRFGLGLLWPNLSPFALYYLVTLLATVTCDVPAGAAAAILGTISGWWFFVPPPFAFFPIPDDTAANIALSFLVSVSIVAIAARE
jgi:hypothetical protein